MAINKEQKAKAVVGVQGGKVAVMGAEGEWGTPQDFKYLTSVSLETNIEDFEQYADDERVVLIPSDNSIDGTIGTTAKDVAFEKAAGYLQELDGGTLADIKIHGYTRCCFYFEFTNIDQATGQPYKVKTWLLNAELKKTGETHETNTNTPTGATYEYPISVYGLNVKDSAGTADAVDDNGFVICAYKVHSYPGDEDYATFGDAVPEPQLPASE